VAWTTPATWSTSELVTAAKMNAQVRDNLLFLYPARAVCTTAAAPSFANNTLTIVRYDTVVEDSDSAVTTGAAWKYTAPVAGLYAVTAAILWETTTAWAGTSAETTEMQIYKNGAAYRALEFLTPISTGGSSGYVHLQGSALVRLAASDTTDIRAVQRTGGALTLIADAKFNYVDICRLSG
jgi:hypothetical protein